MRKNKSGREKNGFSMMVLDDDMTITAALHAYFDAAGYQVTTENDPEYALVRMKEHHYDLLLLDYLMVPLRGDQVVSRLRQFDQETFIILLTGHKELAPPLNTIRELDIQGYYEKSDRFDQLELLVESCVKSIRQLQLIRKYRDSLGQMVNALPQIHQLQPMETIMCQVLESLPDLINRKDGFIVIYPKYLHGMQEGLEQPDYFYVGRGRYPLQNPESASDLFDVKAIQGVLSSGKIAFSGDTCLLPLIRENEEPFGVLGADMDASVQTMAPSLLQIYARQASTAILNALLHDLINQKKDELTHAYSRLQDSYMETIRMLRLAVDAKDIYTRGHSDRVAFYAHKLADMLEKDDAFVERVRLAGLFHDVGKIGVSDQILSKDSRLTDSEYEAVKGHPARGAAILSAISRFKDITNIVLAHHERYDGQGYPNALRGENIPLEARIISIADAFDAMTSNRKYRNDSSLEHAKAQLIEGKNTQFDGKLVDLFLQLLEQYDEMQKQLEWTYSATVSSENRQRK